jgi:hypothetical protein
MPGAVVIEAQDDFAARKLVLAFGIITSKNTKCGLRMTLESAA